MRPIPKTQADLLENSAKGNFSLYFARMTEWQDNGKKDERAIEKLSDKAKAMLFRAGETLKAIHDRQTGILKSIAVQGGMVWEFRARLRSPYISGLGSGHPTETGMILDRNSGLPFIPASAIKGVLRLACALEIASAEPGVVRPAKDKQGKTIEGQWEIDDGHSHLRRYFGDTNTGASDSVRGQLVFLDAFPVAVPAIKTDIMNPHFGEYYKGNQGPLETESPIPVKFLAVEEETEFIFRCFALPLPCRNVTDDLTRPFGATDEQTTVNMFFRALCELGFGAKTAVGYGRFAEPEISKADVFLKRAEKDNERKKQEEERRRQEEELRKFPWRSHFSVLTKVGNWGEFQQAILKFDAWKNEIEVAVKVKEAAEQVRTNFPKKWDAERDRLVREWLELSGMEWPELQQTGQDTPAQNLSVEEQQQIDRIHNLKDWRQFKDSRLQIDALSFPAAEVLKQVFCRPDWGLNKKPKNEEKRKAWKALEARLRKK